MTGAAAKNFRKMPKPIQSRKKANTLIYMIGSSKMFELKRWHLASALVMGLLSSLLILALILWSVLQHREFTALKKPTKKKR